ncbi:hypothetical protein [Bacillus sp. FSL K6-3431]|uniref:hypothetical protein n=1 Tax=Bacillus sp. FSL K6-3431 TaxID=2921500 RepID=UPI0030F804FF
MIALYRDFQSIDWSNCENREEVESYLQVMLGGLTEKIRNVHSEVYAIRAGNWIYPLTVTTENYDDSWIVSPYGQYVVSLEDELAQYIDSRFSRSIIRAVIRFQGGCIRRVKNRIIYIHNFLVSTNLYASKCNIDMEKMTAFLTKEFPEHAIGFRSLNEKTALDWIDQLRNAGYLPYGSRVIYYWHPAERMTKGQRKDHARDRSILRKSGLTKKVVLSEIDMDECERLYDKLYLQKYSPNNPQYTARYMHEMCQSGKFDMITLNNDICVAFGGYFIMNGQMATPFFGWDTDIDEKDGIYRMLSNQLYEKAREKVILMNNSGGAGSYKKARGCQPEMEYSYIYTKHLPVKDRLNWWAIQCLTYTVGSRILWKFR